MSGLDVGLYLAGPSRLAPALEASFARRGARVTRAQPPCAAGIASRVARRLTRGSVAARMAIRDTVEGAWAWLAARQAARRGHDLVIADLAVARAMGARGSTPRLLLLERGPADAIHAALDAEIERAPDFRAHLALYRATADRCRQEREAIAAANHVLVPSRWIARAARAATATAVTVVPPPVAPSAPRRPPVTAAPLRVWVPGVLIGRCGAHPLLECARRLGRDLEIRVAGRAADDPNVLASFRVPILTGAGPLQASSAWADAVVAPWIVDGYCAEAAGAAAAGVPTAMTEAAGGDLLSPGVRLLREGRVDSLMDALEELRCPDRRAALSLRAAAFTRSRSAEAVDGALAAALRSLHLR